MTLYEMYYTAVYNAISKKYCTDIKGAKEIVEKYITELKEKIDNSQDEHAKQFWIDEFGDKAHPTADEFLETIFLFGENPFIPKD